MSTDLAEMQAELTRALIGDSHQRGYEIQSRLSSRSRISPQLALDIYRNNTRGTRVEALAMIYPACKSVLGSDTFQSLALRYVIEDTLGRADLNQYGETFSQYLEILLDTYRLPDEYMYLRDLASLEYQFHAAYYADSDPVFDFKLFEQKVENGEQVHLQLSASLGLLASQYPVYQIWLRNRPGFETSNIGGKSGCDVHSIADTQYLLIHREEYIPVVATVSDQKFYLLEAIENNQSLQTILDRVDCDIDVLLPGLIANKYIIGIKDYD